MNEEVDKYLINGCGRCKYYGTTNCKVRKWQLELNALREILVHSGLKEEVKWSVPCYTYNGKNIVLLAAFKDYVSLAFFKGSLLSDEQKILVAAGKNSQSSRQARYTTVADIVASKAFIKAYIYEAIEIEKAGLKVNFKPKKTSVPVELEDAFNQDLAFKTAFEALTPGRQRGYLIHFSEAKQAKTRITRIEKWKETILKGEGLHDAYRKNC